MTGRVSPLRWSPVCYNKACMERFLNVIKAWQRDPEVIFALLGAVVGTAGVLLFLAGAFPFSPVNFWFFSILLFLLGLYRPNWCFLMLIASIPFEIITVSPDTLGLSLRPYQWIFIALGLAIGVRVLSGRTRWPIFTLSRLDFFLLLIPMGAMISGVLGGGQSIRLAVIVTSFYTLYLLSRVFLKTIGDVRIAVTTLFASGLMMAVYGIVQNIAFERSVVLQAIMPGRPNATFTEPDWLGFFVTALLIVALARLYSVLYHSTEDMRGNVARILGAALLMLPVVIVLILTVSRSAWLAAAGAVFIWALVAVWIGGKESFRPILQSLQSLVIIFVVALLLIIDLPLTRFDLFNRAESTATGLQEITIACDRPTDLPETIGTVDELAAFGCRHIALEERTTLQSAGFSIQTVRRPDPNVAIRSAIYAKTWHEIQQHPVFGIGWGNIGAVLGADEHGSAYNASNIWLEIILGAGLIGFVGLVGALGYIIYCGSTLLLWHHDPRGRTSSLPLIFAFITTFFIFNLFNAGLLIGFVWIVFAMVPPLLSAASERKPV